MRDGRVLYVIQTDDYSGAETAQRPVLRADGDALVACPPASEVDDWLRAADIATIALPFRRLRHSGGGWETVRSVGRGLAAARDLRRILRRHRERDIVYCLSIRAGLLASVASVGLRRRVVWVVPDYLPPPPLRAAVRCVAMTTCDALLPLSEAIAADVVGRSRRLRSRTTVVHPGVDERALAVTATRPGAPRAAIVGHVSPLKRTDLALDITRRVRATIPDFTLEVIGRAQYRDEDFAFERHLRERAEHDESLRGGVRFHGKMRDVGDVLATCGLLVHCRDDEPFGMVLIEAMAAGLPVVAPARGGPVEIVVDGVTGLLYPPGDAVAAAAAVVRIVQDPDFARQLGEAGRHRIESLFDATRMVDAVHTALR